MKVSCVTLRVFALLLAASLGCHRAGPGSAHALKLDPARALAAPPLESITLHFSAPAGAARTLVRQTLFNAGIQVDSENRKAGWMRAPLGGTWDGQLYKQWFIVASYYATDSTRSVVILRGIEQANSYIATMGSRTAGPGAVAAAGSNRVGLVSDATRGSARSVWLKMEQVAYLLGEGGGSRLIPP